MEKLMRLFAVTVSSPGGCCTEPPPPGSSRPERHPIQTAPTLMGKGKRCPLAASSQSTDRLWELGWRVAVYRGQVTGSSKGPPENLRPVGWPCLWSQMLWSIEVLTAEKLQENNLLPHRIIGITRKMSSQQGVLTLGLYLTFPCIFFGEEKCELLY